MKKKKAKTVCLIILALVALSTLAYQIQVSHDLNINFKSTNQSAGKYTVSQGDYILTCADNGIFDMPFFMGGKLYIESISDGKKYIVADNKGLLKGITYPIIVGDMVCWFESWDSSNQGAVHITNIRDKSRKYNVPEFIYSNVIAFDGERLFYVKDPDEDGVGDLISHDIKTGKNITLIENWNPDYLGIVDGVLYGYSSTADKLSMISIKTGKKKSIRLKLHENEDGTAVLDIVKYDSHMILIQTLKDGIIRLNTLSGTIKDTLTPRYDLNKCYSICAENIHLRGKYLYYHDEAWNIYRMDCSTKAVKKIVKWSEISEVKKIADNMGTDAQVTLYWCDDYIGVMIDCYNHANMMMVFDYKGDLKRIKQ